MATYRVSAACAAARGNSGTDVAKRGDDAVVAGHHEHLAAGELPKVADAS